MKLITVELLFILASWLIRENAMNDSSQIERCVSKEKLSSTAQKRHQPSRHFAEECFDVSSVAEY